MRRYKPMREAPRTPARPPSTDGTYQRTPMRARWRAQNKTWSLYYLQWHEMDRLLAHLLDVQFRLALARPRPRLLIDNDVLHGVLPRYLGLPANAPRRKYCSASRPCCANWRTPTSKQHWSGAACPDPDRVDRLSTHNWRMT